MTPSAPSLPLPTDPTGSSREPLDTVAEADARVLGLVRGVAHHPGPLVLHEAQPLVGVLALAQELAAVLPLIRGQVGAVDEVRLRTLRSDERHRLHVRRRRRTPRSGRPPARPG